MAGCSAAFNSRPLVPAGRRLPSSTWGWLTLAWAAALADASPHRVATTCRSRQPVAPSLRKGSQLPTLRFYETSQFQSSRGSGRPPLHPESAAGTSTWGNEDWPDRWRSSAPARIPIRRWDPAHARPSKPFRCDRTGGPGPLAVGPVNFRRANCGISKDSSNPSAPKALLQGEPNSATNCA